MIAFDPSIDNPYVGPRTFTRAQSSLFFGRESEARDLLARVVSERLLLFYAQSGAGKSSLINTRLIPQLQEEGFAVLPVGRVSGELPAGVSQVPNIFLFNLMLSLDLDACDPARLAGLSLSEFLAHLVSEDGERWAYDPAATPASPQAEGEPRPSTPVQPFVLVIDQFEEIITAHPGRWEERGEFFRQLDSALLGDPNLWVVLTLREDYVAALDPYAALMFNRLRARFYMERMGVAAALDAICCPADLGGRPFEAGVAERLVDNLRQMRVAGQEGTTSGQYIEPVQLQVVCYQLWENIVGRPVGPITEADLREAGDVDRALTQFYDETLAAVLAEASGLVSERELRTWFHREIITDAGTRNLIHQGEQLTGTLPNSAVRLLQKRFLVRAEARSGDTWVELVHDRFVEPIRQSNRAWFNRNQNPLTQAAIAWDAAGRDPARLYTGAQLSMAAVDLRNQPRDYGALEQAFVKEGEEAESLRTARRQRLILWTAVMLSVVFVSLAVWGLWSAFQAGLSERQAYQQKERADAEAGRANREAELAQAASKAAEEQRITAVEAQQRAEVAGKAAAADRDSLAILAANLAAVLTAQATPRSAALQASPTPGKTAVAIRTATPQPNPTSSGTAGVSTGTPTPSPEVAAIISAAQDQLATVQARQTADAATITVYMQVPTDAVKEQATQLQAFLRKKGYVVPDIEVVGPNRSPRSSEIRYMYPNQEQRARQLQADMALFGLGNFDVKYVRGYEGRARQDVIEVWFNQ